MKLKSIFIDIELEDSIKNLDVTNLTFDSRDVTNGSVFFCLSGGNADGHAFAYDAEKRGAVAIVATQQTASTLPHILVEDTRASLSLASSMFFGEPSKKLTMIGITGTNGKTTTTYIVESILKAAGIKTGVIGTTAIIIDGVRLETKLTTPDPTDFHAILARMVEVGVTHVVMEVSAHALALKKMEGVQFEVSAFTNLSRDHLDFFGTMENYYNAKTQLFSPKLSKFCVLNADDEWVAKFISECSISHYTFGFNNPADIFAIDLKQSAGGLSYILNLSDDITEIKFNMPGKFNAYNTLCAATIAKRLSIPLKAIVEGIRNIKKVDGRFQIINTSKCSVIVDFAHTDDGLINILSTIREFTPNNRIITVFGCGGDRDKTKRPVMGDIVSKHSDFFFITSDNPRTENPDNIIADVARGVPKNRCDYMRLITDRKEAIRKAVEFAEDGDVVLVAGKGAEPYIDIAGVKIPYSDEEFILEVIEEQKL
ncbi:MAG: UDP-N-acetylmuramoyl-L-alanyl-D-glutamate--2,6-diaminopimelate ligase [Firmicutes bacterium]|nr:UDP-N-acetylmuramoyl-L-alanyl-D-glutamate--2,6-diaminopimelate ligase [Bacillota bacterium]